MPDFTSKANHEFWKSFQDPSIYKVISFMESVEGWTLDGDPDLERSIAELGKSLDDLGAVELNEEESFVRLGAYIKTGRILHILMSMDQAHPGSASKVLMHAESNSGDENSDSKKFLKRNVAFERLRLLSRMFSEDRLQLLQRALEESHG